MGRVVHFEITADDVTRAKQFYEIFDWEMRDSADEIPGMSTNKYLVAKTGEDEDMGTNGAIMTREFRQEPVIIWVSVDDLDETIEKVKAAGGELVGDKHAVPGIGDTIYAKDTEGNTIGLIQALPRQKDS
jgi:predicted enzyme related to lactoylglutathione lyase